MQCGITSLQSSVGHALALLPPAADTKILPAPFGLGTIKCRRRQKVRPDDCKEAMPSLSLRKESKLLFDLGSAIFLILLILAVHISPCI